jgi:hypothetical protein
MTDTSAQVSDAAGMAAEKAKDAAGQAMDKSRELTGQVADKAHDQIGQRSDQVGDQVESAAADARAVSEQLKEQGNDAAARLVEQTAGHAQKVADYLTESDPDRIIADVQTYARKQPWLVALGGVAVGFAASRMVKASAGSSSSSSIGSGQSRVAATDAERD